MRRSNSFAGMKCHIAHTLEAIGDEWSFLIVRDCLKGMTRFEELQQSLPISPTVLTGRLNKLVESKVLERVQYSTRPPRYEYLLTEMGADLLNVIDILEEWGRDHLPSDGHATRRDIEGVAEKSGAAVQVLDRG